MRIQQNADGSYQKEFTETEILILRELSAEKKRREYEDRLLQAKVKVLAQEVESLQARVKALEAKTK